MDKIAERVFALKRADLRKLREYGFKENEEGEFCLSCDIAEGRMRLGITVAADGSVRTKVTDVDTDDPYTLYLVEDAVGGSVHERTSVLSTAVRCRAGDINGVENEDMTDLEKAKSMLADDCNLAVVKGGSASRFSESGIKALLGIAESNKELLDGASVADKIVGRAAAFVMVSCGVKEVYAGVMSKGAAALFAVHGVPCSCATLTDRIINRAGTDICPMERAVLSVPDNAPDEAVAALRSAFANMRSGQ